MSNINEQITEIEPRAILACFSLNEIAPYLARHNVEQMQGVSRDYRHQHEMHDQERYSPDEYVRPSLVKLAPDQRIESEGQERDDGKLFCPKNHPHCGACKDVQRAVSLLLGEVEEHERQRQKKRHNGVGIDSRRYGNMEWHAGQDQCRIESCSPAPLTVGKQIHGPNLGDRAQKRPHVCGDRAQTKEIDAETSRNIETITEPAVVVGRRPNAAGDLHGAPQVKSVIRTEEPVQEHYAQQSSEDQKCQQKVPR